MCSTEAQAAPEPVAPVRRRKSKGKLPAFDATGLDGPNPADGPVAPPRRKRGNRNTTISDLDPEIAKIENRPKRSKTPTEEEILSNVLLTCVAFWPMRLKPFDPPSRLNPG